MSFQVGQKIVFLHDAGGGKILEILEKRYLILDDDGFERLCLANEIGPVHGSEYRIDDTAIKGINEDESFATGSHASRSGQLTGSRKPVEVWEIDLHIEALTDSHSGWTNTDIVRKQMLEFRSFFKRAQSRRIRKLVVIHGVGTGVLKEEVREFLRKQDGVEFFDADYAEYGKGATAVELRYNH